MRGSCWAGWRASSPIVGLSPFILAAIAAFGVMYADQPLQFFGAIPIRGRTLAIGMAVLVAVQVVLGHTWVIGVGDFAAMAFGLLWVTRGRLPLRMWMLRFLSLALAPQGHRDRRRAAVSPS